MRFMKTNLKLKQQKKSKVYLLALLVFVFIQCTNKPADDTQNSNNDNSGTLTDQEIVAADAAALNIVFTGDDTVDSVTQDVTLPNAGDNGSTITWESSDTAIINTDGTVSRPSFLAGNQIVTLTATVFKNGVSQKETFTLTVICQDHVGSKYYVSTTGDDANDGLSVANAKLTINSALGAGTAGDVVLVAVGTYTVDSQAGAGNHIVLVEGISILGGYSSDFSIRNATTYTTTLEDVSSTASGLESSPNRVIQGGTGITNATIIDGFTILGTTNAPATTKYTAGILMEFGSASSPVIQNCIIDGGSGNTVTSGIRSASSSSLVIRNNSITGGNGASSNYGILFSTFGTAVISENNIQGGSGSLSHGIGINSGPTYVVIENNIINGGSGSTYSFGINGAVIDNLKIRNNVIHGGNSTGGTRGVQVYSTGSFVDNNTIDGGSAGTISSAITIYSSTAAPTIQNNILYTTVGSLRYCIYEFFGTTPAGVYNNNLYNCPDALYKDSTMKITVIDDVNAFGAIYSGNISVDPGFVSGSDFHLTAGSPVDVREGGLDLSAGFTTDMDNAARTAVVNGTPSNANAAGWSIGAYEFD